MSAVVIGVDPHKRSNTALVLDREERVLARKRFANDRNGYRQLKAFARDWRERTWAVEGAHGVGLGLAQRLAAEGETVLNVPAKLSARVRALGGGSGRKTDDTDAYAVAVAGLRGKGLERVSPGDTVTVFKLLADRRQQLVERRIATVNRLHDLLQTLIPGGAPGGLTAKKARALLSRVRPRDEVGKARKAVACDQLADLVSVDRQLKQMKQQLAVVLAEHPSTVQGIYGFGVLGTAVALGEVGDVRRFPSKGHFASYTGTAPIDASSGDNVRHRLNRGGNRRLNKVLHTAAIVQISQHHSEGSVYYERKLAEGKTKLEALRCLKRRLSDVLYRALLVDLQQNTAAGPGGTREAMLTISAADLTARTTNKSRPGPVLPDATPGTEQLASASR